MINRRRFLAGSTGLLLAAACGRQGSRVSVGTKNFTEQLVLGELLAQMMEARVRLAVERRFYLAGSYICHQAILAGRIDTYIEYTGTALAAILKEPVRSDPSEVFEIVRREYERRFGLAVLPSLGFNNSFAIVMRGDDARAKGITKLSQLAAHAPTTRIGVGYEFLEREDGFQGLARTYGLRFAASPTVMDLGLIYRALQAKQVDIVVGSNTDGLIAALGLVVLDDDRRYFPPYEAVPIVWPEALRAPGTQSVFDALAGRITTEDMRHMNHAVDGEKRDVVDVVRSFRKSKGL
jgi:osmoprotectant transport system substrate-binding protein